MTIAVLDKFIYYCLLLYALLSSITIAGTNIAISMAALAAIIRYFREPITINLDQRLVKAIFVFLSAALLSAIFAYYPLDGIKTTANYLYRMLPLFLAAAFIRNKQQLFQIIAVTAISLALADSVAIWRGLSGNFRAHGFGGNYMVMAGFLLQMIPLLLVISLEGSFLSNKYRAACFAVFFLSCIALVYNGTRGVWIAVGLTIPLGLICIKTNKKQAVSLLVLLCISAVLLMQIPVINDRVHSITDMNNQSNSERILLWQSSWHMFLDHPLTGIGTGNFEELYVDRYMSPLAKEKLTNAHSIYMNALGEMGAIGFSAFIFLFGYILYQSYCKMKCPSQRIWGLAALLFTLSLLIQGFTQTNFIDSAVIRMYWFLLGVMQAAYHLEESENV
ncbi:MAG: O-antigen ligase family protein [Negativicutes bacterium]